ncbi:MAG: hypothetical protein JRI70_11755 [Deltaproteobacteria bacterium]|nr:hypothetical protein [Deltaproteobacteria bacterium]
MLKSIDYPKAKTGLVYTCILFMIFAIAGLPASSLAHKLSVFAWVECDTVVVEGKLGGSKRPKRGFPLKDYQTGLKIVVDIGEGHQSFWILTPNDIESQLQEQDK